MRDKAKRTQTTSQDNKEERESKSRVRNLTLVRYYTSGARTARPFASDYEGQAGKGLLEGGLVGKWKQCCQNSINFTFRNEFNSI